MSDNWLREPRPDPSAGTSSLAVAVLCASWAGLLLLVRLHWLPVQQPDLVFRSLALLAGCTAFTVVLGVLLARGGKSNGHYALVVAALWGLLTNSLFVLLFDRVALSSWHPDFQAAADDRSRRGEARLHVRRYAQPQHFALMPTPSAHVAPVETVEAAGTHPTSRSGQGQAGNVPDSAVTIRVGVAAIPAPRQNFAPSSESVPAPSTSSTRPRTATGGNRPETIVVPDVEVPSSALATMEVAPASIRGFEAAHERLGPSDPTVSTPDVLAHPSASVSVRPADLGTIGAEPRAVVPVQLPTATTVFRRSASQVPPALAVRDVQVPDAEATPVYDATRSDALTAVETSSTSPSESYSVEMADADRWWSEEISPPKVAVSNPAAVIPWDLPQGAPIDAGSHRFAAKGATRAPDIQAAVVLSVQPSPESAFGGRAGRRADRTRTELPVDQEINAAIESGLEYLARCQSEDGRWRLQNLPSGTQAHDPAPSVESETAATGLALLAFLGAGYHHQSERYRDTIARGLEFLLRHQAPSGDLYLRQGNASDDTVWLYSHAIATTAVCEGYGMTGDTKLRVPAQRAVDFIVATQHPELGGWRYTPGVGADTSVTGWMLVALKSGELSGLQVSDVVYDKVRTWLEQASFGLDRPYWYRYNPLASDSPQQRHGRVPSRAMSAVGMVMSLYLGTSPNDPIYRDGIEQLRRFPPQIGTLRAPLRDGYYWYYATLAAYYAGGETWSHWNQGVRKLILESQVQRGDWTGSWDPFHPVPDRWADHGGRLYVTVMNLLCLEVEYRHLPLYRHGSPVDGS